MDVAQWCYKFTVLINGETSDKHQSKGFSILNREDPLYAYLSSPQ